MLCDSRQGNNLSDHEPLTPDLMYAKRVWVLGKVTPKKVIIFFSEICSVTKGCHSIQSNGTLGTTHLVRRTEMQRNHQSKLLDRAWSGLQHTGQARGTVGIREEPLPTQPGQAESGVRWLPGGGDALLRAPEAIGCDPWPHHW